MKYLSQFGVLREESNQTIIDNLIRKGWKEIFPPSFDPSSQKLDFNSLEEKFIVSNISDYEKKEMDKNAAIKAGFLVSPENFYLALKDNDRVLFSQMLSLVKEALDLGYITNDTPQSIKDINGETRVISTLRFRQIMVPYGFYYKTLWDSYS